MKKQHTTPVDLSKKFRQSGMTLITDTASDRYLDDYTKLATSLQEGEEKKT